jgi:hypothetical protein
VIPTQMLVRHGPEPGGWTWTETDPGDGPRRAALHNLPNLTKTEATKATTDLLATLDAEVSYRVGIDPDGDGDIVGTDWWLGDVVTIEGGEDELRAQAFTIGLDTARPGRIVKVPELGAPTNPPSVKQGMINKRMSNGTVGGRSPVAVPIGYARGQAPGDGPDTGGCCTSAFQGFGAGTLDDIGSDSVEIACPAPEGSQPGYLYQTEYGPTVIGPGNWTVNGVAYITWDTPVTPLDQAEVWWYPGVGPSSGVTGFVYGVVPEIPDGTETTAVDFSGVVNVPPGNTWEPYVEVFGNYFGARTAGINVYLHAYGGGCACPTSVTENPE